SEIVFSAIGMNPPGFASSAPAPTIATAGDEASPPIRSIAAFVWAGSGGLRKKRTATTTSTAPNTTSRIATHVFGVDGDEDAAASPRMTAAAIPTASVAVSAPSRNQQPVRNGRGD